METIFIRQVNHLKSIKNIKYQHNWMILTHEKLTIRLSSFCSTATVTFWLYLSCAPKRRNLQRLRITRFFLYKHKVHKHTQPQIREILSTLLSTPPALDFEIDNKISEKLQFFPKISEKNSIFSPKFQNNDLHIEIRNTLKCFSF